MNRRNADSCRVGGLSTNSPARSSQAAGRRASRRILLDRESKIIKRAKIADDETLDIREISNSPVEVTYFYVLMHCSSIQRAPYWNIPEYLVQNVEIPISLNKL